MYVVVHTLFCVCVCVCFFCIFFLFKCLFYCAVPCVVSGMKIISLGRRWTGCFALVPFDVVWM